MKIYFVTSNRGKYLEAKEKLSKIGIDVIQKNLGYPEIQADSLEEVAVFGIQHVQKFFDKPFILEDAGLFVDELDGFPGVYSSYVYHTIGCIGVLNLMKDKKNRKATFRSVFGYGAPNKKPRLFVGECLGSISENKKGSHGFGYDPIFIPKGESRTFAEMEISEKNRFSHRSRSLQKFLDSIK